MAFFNKERLRAAAQPRLPEPTYTLLLVDDEPSNLHVLSDILSEEYHVLTANHAEAALQILETQATPHSIQLIITDHRMPGMTGAELLERVHERWPTIIRMILTGFADVDNIIDSINKGRIYQFMLKPFDRNDVMQAVKRALEWYEMEHKNRQLVVELQTLNSNLEQKVKERTQQLEQQNTVLTASNRKLEDLNTTKEQFLKKIQTLSKDHLVPLAQLLQQADPHQAAETLREVAREIHEMQEIVRPFASLYSCEQAIQSKRVLLAESNKKQQVLAKMALNGTGVQLDLVSGLEEGAAALAERHYDILCTNTDFLQLMNVAHEKSPKTQCVLMTGEPLPTSLPLLRDYPFVSNIVSRNEDDRTFTLKNIFATVSKLISRDLFGLEKYLSWGVDVQQRPVARSHERLDLIEEMEGYLKSFGLRSTIVNRAGLVAEELLMNAIYDAPTDPQGRPLYNHLPRTTPIELKPSEQATLGYACDGMLLAVSVCDPFGMLDRTTILAYLERCYQGNALQNAEYSSGGAGHGLFYLIEIADLVVINVKPKVKTEVITIFNVDPNKPKINKNSSFHFFYD